MKYSEQIKNFDPLSFDHVCSTEFRSCLLSTACRSNIKVENSHVRKVVFVDVSSLIQSSRNFAISGRELLDPDIAFSKQKFDTRI